jgi:hypothetical protein
MVKTFERFHVKLTIKTESSCIAHIYCSSIRAAVDAVMAN